jgi:hypothetical protein
MADKTPVRVVYNSSNVATGLAEFQSAESIGYAFGGTGLTSLGSAGQVLKVNAAATGLEFGAEGDISITNLVAPTNADLTLTTSGTGNIVLDGVTVRGTTLSAADSSKITIAESLDVTGTSTLSGLAYPTSDGSAGQFLKTDGSGTLTFASVTLGDFSFIGSTLSTPSNADLTLSPGGTGNVIAGAITINGTTLSSVDSSKITLAESVDVTGTLTSSTVAITGGTITGITDLTVADGGTGASSLTDNAVLTGTGASALTAESNLTFDGSTLAITGNLTLTTDLVVAHGGTGASTLASDAVLTGTGTSAITAEGNLSFNGSTLAVTGAATISSTLTVTGNTTLNNPLTVVNVVTNDITSNGSNANIDIAPQGTGKVQFNSAYTFPTADGDDGQALVTDGSGALSFGTVGAASVSDDSLGVAGANKIITSTARTIDSFHSTFQDSAFYMVVSNDHSEDCINVQAVSLCHNNTTAFVSSSGVISKAGGTDMTAFTADISSNMVRLKAASTNAVGGRASFYKFGLGDNSSAATSGNVIVTINADVDSASEALVSFAHASYRGAKLFISINSDSKTEVGNIEALCVHDGTTGYITTYNQIASGNSDLISLTGAISGSDFVVSAAGYEPNLRVTVHAIMLKDTMVTDAGTYANTEAIAPVTVSSTATEVDTLIETTNNGAVYYFVSKNASEGTYAVNEVFVALGSGECAIAGGAYVSTKGTNQLAFTSDYKDDVEATGSILAASTSGGSTTVSAYRLNALAN